MQSLLNAKYVAMGFTGKAFEYDTVLHFIDTYQTIQGRSWELALALGFSSLLTGVPLSSGITISGVIAGNGNIVPVASLSRKIMAAKEAGFHTFLV